MELHSVGGNRPMYESVDKAILEKTADIDEIIKNMEISANNKMIFQR